MPDDAAPSQAEASLDDLERRLASFESATKRLNRNVGGMQEPEPATVGHSSPPRPATRRLSESGAPRSDEISGLRPAVQAQGPQTGALTARNRQGVGDTPGFTSKFGKPAIALVPATTTTPAAQPLPSTAPTSRRVPHRRARLRWALTIGGCAILLVLLLLPRAFTTLGNAMVWADEQRVTASASGPVEAVPVRVGNTVTAGQELARIAGASCPAPAAGTVVRLLATPGMRIAAGEPVAVLAAPGTTRIVAVLPSSVTVEIGHRVQINLLGERRDLGGSIEQVLASGAAGPWASGGQPPARIVIQPDPSPLPVQLGQGARVTLLGAPTTWRQLLFAIRQVLPW